MKKKDKSFRKQLVKAVRNSGVFSKPDYSDGEYVVKVKMKRIIEKKPPIQIFKPGGKYF